MVIKLLLIFIILFLRYISRLNRHKIFYYKQEQRYHIFVWSLIVLMAAFRGINVGADTIGYLYDYRILPTMSFEDIAYRYEGYLGYFYTSKIFSLMAMPHWIWFGFVEALYAISLAKLTSRYSQDKLFSVLVFVTIGLFSFSMAGMKQVMSMSLVNFAFLSFLDKKYLRTIILFIYAYTCHPTSLVFLGVIPIYLLRNKSYYTIALLSVLVLIVTNSFLFLSSMVSLLGNEHFETYLDYDNSYSSTTLYLYVLITLIASIGFKAYLKRDKENFRFLLGLSLVVIALQTLSGISPNMFRLALFYAPFLMFLIPKSCKNMPANFKTVIQLAVIAVLVLYYLYTGRNTPYTFLTNLL